MILLDTHIWVWWANDARQLSDRHAKIIHEQTKTDLAICAISCWEIGKLVEGNRLQLTIPVRDWVDRALTHPKLSAIPLTPLIALESTLLPDWNHRDPADRFIVATARAYDCTVLTADERILNYKHVKSI